MIGEKIIDRIVQLDKLKEFIVPLHQEEFDQLERNILKEGCRDPLTVWRKPQSNDYVLVDGHNRFKICQQNQISFDVTVKEFSNIEEAIFWMINNQLGRRNLNPDQMSYYRGLKYENLKKNRGGYEFIKSVGQNELPTYTKLAREFNVSESTIKRDSKYAKGLNLIGKFNNELKNQILTGVSKLKKGDITLFSEINPSSIKRLVNEKDLLNQVGAYRNSLLQEIESELNKKELDQIEKAQEELSRRDPIFDDSDNRVQRIKANIMSAVNRAIKEKDISAMNELKGLIEKLELILFSE